MKKLKSLYALTTDPAWLGMFDILVIGFKDMRDNAIKRRRAAYLVCKPLWFVVESWSKWTAWRISAELRKYAPRT